MDRKHLYQIYTKHQQYAYFVPQTEPRLRRYVEQRIPVDRSPMQVSQAAQILVEEVQRLPLERQTYNLQAKNQSGSITALLGHILFRQQKVRLHHTLEILQRYFQGTDLEDVCQFSLIVISHPAKFLGNFRPEQNWYESFCRYSQCKFPHSLTDELRRLAGDKFQRTNLGVLARASAKSIDTITAAQFPRGAGLFNRSILLYQCFQEVVKAQEFATNDPQPAHYAALLARYQERQKPSDSDIASLDEIKAILEDLGAGARHYYQPLHNSLPLDAPIYPNEQSSTAVTLGDIQIDASSSLVLEDQDKRDIALGLISRYAPNYGDRLPELAAPSDQRLDKARSTDLTLFLLDGLRLTQSEAGVELERHFTVIGHRRKSELANLAKEFYRRYEQPAAVKQLSAEILDKYIRYIEPLCEDYYAELAINMWEEAIASTPNASNVAELLIDRIQTRWQFKFKPEGKGLSKVYALVEWQQNRGKWHDPAKIHPNLRSEI